MVTKRFALVAGLVLILAGVGQAAKVEVRQIPSQEMKKAFPATIITPDSYAKDKNNYPVLYLLHGFGADHKDWNARTEIAKLVDQYHLIVVCPDGNGDSWYLDAPNDPTRRFETYISKEVVAFTDANYRTIKSTKGRGITGVSMGGHGGLFLGFRHQDVYGACGATSGGVDLRPYPDNWNIKDRLGTLTEHPELWAEYSVVNNVDKIKPEAKQAIFFDCGVDDFFIAPNRALHEALLKKQIPHDYTERPGGHAWPYWQNSIQYQVLFFHNYFETAAHAK